MLIRYDGSHCTALGILFRHKILKFINIENFGFK